MSENEAARRAVLERGRARVGDVKVDPSNLTDPASAKQGSPFEIPDKFRDRDHLVQWLEALIEAVTPETADSASAAFDGHITQKFGLLSLAEAGRLYDELQIVERFRTAIAQAREAARAAEAENAAEPPTAAAEAPPKATKSPLDPEEVRQRKQARRESLARDAQDTVGDSVVWEEGCKMPAIQAWAHTIISARDGVSRRAIRVAWALQFYFNRKNSGAWMKNETLMKETGLSKSALHDALQELVKRRFIHIENGSGKDRRKIFPMRRLTDENGISY